MALVTVTSPSGRTYQVNIAGTAPTPEEQARIDQYVASQEQPPAPAQAPADGEGGGLSAAAGMGVDMLQQGLGSSVEGIGGLIGWDAMRDYGAGVAKANDEQIRAASEGMTNWDEVNGLGSAAKFYGETLAQQVPQLGVSMAGGYAGAQAGGTLGSAFGPAGAVIGAGLGGIAGGALANLPFFYGSNRERQKQEMEAQGKPLQVDEGAAALAAVGQATLDAAVDRMLLGKLIPAKVGKFLESGNMFTRFVKGGVGGAIVETPTEVGQQLLERAQAGKPLFDDEALKEYADTAIASGLVGGTVGGVTGATGENAVIKEQREKDAKAKKELDEDQTEDADTIIARLDRGLKANEQVGQDTAPPAASAPVLGLPAPSEGAGATSGQTPSAAPPTAPAAQAQKPFLWSQYQSALARVMQDGKFSIPAIQAAAKTSPKENVPLSTATAIRDEMIAQGVLQSDGKEKPKFKVNTAAQTGVDTMESYRRTVSDIDTQLERSRVAREKALQDARRAAQTGTEAEARKLMLEADGHEQNINKLVQTRAEISARAQRELGTRTPKVEDTTNPLADGQKVVPFKEAGPEGQQKAVDDRNQRIGQAVQYYEGKVAEKRAELARLQAAGKKVQLPKSEKQRIAVLRDEVAKHQSDITKLKAKLKNPDADLMAAQAERAANEAKAAAAQAERAALTPVYSGKQQQVFNALRTRLNNMGLKDVRLTAERILRPDMAKDGKLVEGEFDVTPEGKRAIALSMSIYDENMSGQQLFDALSRVMDHEIIHALKNMGLLTDAEWKTLAEVAKRQKYIRMKGDTKVERSYTYMDRARHMYGDASPEVIEEEAIAEMFRDYMQGKLKIGGRPRSLMERIKDFFSAIWKSHKDAGITDPNQIFEDIRFGRVGARERGTAQPEEVSRQSMWALPEGVATEEEVRDPKDIMMPIDPNAPEDQVRGQIRKLTNENRDLVQGLIKEIDKTFGTKSGDNVKDLAKVTQKAKRPSILYKKPWHTVAHIRDSYRFKTVINDFRDVPSIFQRLLDTGTQLVKIDTNKLLEPQQWGWRIIAFDLRMPNGQLVEWYLPLKELERQKKDEGHHIFEEWRNKTQAQILAENDAYMAAIRRSFEGYDDAFQQALDRMGITRQEAEDSWRRAESSLLEAARNSRKSSGVMTSSSVSGRGFQTPSNVRMAVEPSSRNNMARGVPSSTSANSLGMGVTSSDNLAEVGGEVNESALRRSLAMVTRRGERNMDPITAPVKRNGKETIVFGNVMEDGQLRTVILPEGNHSDTNRAGHGLAHIVARGHDEELYSTSKYKSVNQAIYDMLYRWAKQGYQNGDDVIGYPYDGNYTLEWNRNLGYGSKPLRLVLQRNELGGGFVVYSVKTFFPVIPKADVKRRSMLKVDGVYDPQRVDAVEQANRSRVITKMKPNGDTPDRISTRQPYTKRATEDPLVQNLIIDLAAMKASPAAFEHNMRLLKTYTGFVTKNDDPDLIAEDFIRFVEDNLNWLYQHVPAAIRNRSKLWYKGARRITENWSGQYEVPDYTVAGVLAALSPQKDWYQNVSLAERVLDIHTTFTRGNMVGFTPDEAMVEAGTRIYKKYPKALAKILSRPYTDLDSDIERAMWLRTYDEAHNPRGYRTVSAEGDFIGEPSGKVAWGSNGEIAKAIYALRNQNRDMVSAAMGEKHKVRNFYNNILAPDAPHGDVTIDTHAVAAGLIRPLSGASAEVHHNFGSSPEKKKQPADWVPAKSIGDSGASGTYGIYAEAYRRAAAKLGILPRELQSITWEAVRGLFPAVDKRNKGKVELVNNEWRKVSNGEQTAAEARENISRIMGGVNEPTWHGLSDPAANRRGASSYEGELAISRLDRQWRDIGGTDVGDAGGVGQSGGRAGIAAGDVYAGRGRAPRGVRPRGSVRYSVLDGRAGDGGRGQEVRGLAPLEGAPRVQGASGPDLRLVRVAEDYARSIGIELKRQAEYVKADPERGARIAQEYEKMAHAPNDPKVREAYQNLIDQTVAQYKALRDAGYKFWFMDPENVGEYGESPWNAMRDLRANQSMGVYPTTGGFGTDQEADTSGNPLLAETEFRWPFGSPDGPLVPVLANDLFRAVHDAFGHGLEGSGFRADGEENAWQAHVRLFTGSAVGAITSETRGQNSWLNFGPYGESNRNAKVEDTHFADQKTGLMPEWTWTEGRVADAEDYPHSVDTKRQSMLSVRQSSVPQATAGQVRQAEKALMYARSADLLAKVLNLKGYGVEQKKAQRFADGLLRRFQDNMLPMGRMIQELSAQGMTITDAMDTYLQEELMHGVVGAKVSDNQDRLFKPMIEAIKRINVPKAQIDQLVKISDAAAGGRGYVGLALEDSDSPRTVLADAYLYARHAKERNAYILKNKDKENFSGSGMTDKEADAILAWFNGLDTANKLAVQDMAKGVRAIVANTNQTRVDAGLISQDVVAENPYKFYVPLRGITDEDIDAEEDTSKGPPSRPRFGARGREDRKALGRTMYAADIVANLLTQNQNAILRGERNKVGQSFLKLLRSDQATTLPYARILPTAPNMRVSIDGKIRYVPDPRAADNPRILVVKEDGKQVYVQFEDERLAGAMNGRNGMGPANQNLLIQAMQKVNRYLANINTSLNPEFMIANMLRDLQTAGVNVNQFEKEGLTKSVLTSIPSALKGIKKVIRNGDDTSEWSKVYKDFIASGGQNATNQFNSLAEEMDNIRSMLGDISDAGIHGRFNRVRQGFVGKGVGSLLHLVEDYNTVIENGVRVATYKALLDKGFTKQRAAQAARNVTVNFAKGGDYRQFMGAWYLFYNASIQGSFALLNGAIRSPKVRKLWAGVIAAGILQDQLNALVGDDDDDGEKLYDKIPQYILEHNFILPDPFGITDRSYIAIPMPYGLNMAHNLGRAISRTARGGYDAGEATGSIFGTMLDTLNPIGGSESWANAVAPTIADPFIDIIQNEDFSGKPIFKENLPFDKTPTPDSQMYWQTTSPNAVWVANALNSITGGNRVRSGLIDWSPDVLEYWFDQATGGVGRFVQRTVELPQRVAEGNVGDELVSNIPFVRKTVGSISTREDQSNYIERSKRVLMAGEELKQAREAGDAKWARDTIQNYGQELRLLGLVKNTETALKKVSKMRNEVLNNTRLPEDRKRAILDALDEKKKALIDRANRALLTIE